MSPLDVPGIDRDGAGLILRNKSLDNSCSDDYSLLPMGAVTFAPPTHRFDSPQQEVFLNLWRTYDRFRALEEELFGRYGLTPQQYNALRILRAARPRKVPTLTLAARLISRAPDITRLLDRLLERGLVERERPADNRRVVLIGITPEGSDLLDNLAAEVRQCHERQLGHLDEAEMRSLVDLLRRAREPHEPDGSEWR